MKFLRRLFKRSKQVEKQTGLVDETRVINSEIQEVYFTERESNAYIAGYLYCMVRDKLTGQSKAVTEFIKAHLGSEEDTKVNTEDLPKVIVTKEINELCFLIEKRGIILREENIRGFVEGVCFNRDLN